MAKIVLSTEGYWVGKEIDSGSRYISFDPECYQYPNEKIVPCTEEELSKAAKEHLLIDILPHAHLEVKKKIFHFLCKKDLCGMKFLLHHSSGEYGIMKILPLDEEE